MARDKETTYRIMSAIKSKGTIPENILGKALWSRGLRYRKHYKKLEGKPDFVFVKAKIAVFCDGDFWHGNNWRIRGLGSLEEELAGYSQFWAHKITRNIERDRATDSILQSKGWKVIRFWENEIRNSPQTCAQIVADIHKEQVGL